MYVEVLIGPWELNVADPDPGLWEPGHLLEVELGPELTVVPPGPTRGGHVAVSKRRTMAPPCDFAHH